jgi:septal ring factor EnvC (AmiA/AmiB activator)
MRSEPGHLARAALALAVGATFALGALVGPLATSPASATDPAQQLSSVRSRVDALANQYFTARQQLAALDTELAQLRTRRAGIDRSYATEHRVAVQRAVARYTEGTMMTSSAADALDAARTDVLMETAAQTTNAAMSRYAQTRADLLTTEQRIASRQRAQTKLVADLAARTRTLDGELASAQRAYREVLAARARADALAAAARTTDAKHPSATHTVRTPVIPPPSTQPVSTPPPPAPPGTNPHHGDPFLSCVRQRESHGIYTAVNPGGYYGAYQFAATTWNITASHAARPDLIGVRPDHASAWDQDQLAWTLYQWQGEAPWGGHCG